MKTSHCFHFCLELPVIQLICPTAYSGHTAQFSYGQMVPHSKNTGYVKLDPERVNGVKVPPGQRWPGNLATWRECDPMLGQSDLIICKVCRKLTKFRVIVDPERNMTPMDPFPGHADPGVLRVYIYNPSTGYKKKRDQDFIRLKVNHLLVEYLA